MSKIGKHKKYLEYLHTLPCVVTGCEPYGYSDIVAHHICLDSYGLRGIGSKVSDYRAIPLEAATHMRLHHVGERVFWEEVGINPFQKALDILIAYLKANGS